MCKLNAESLYFIQLVECWHEFLFVLCKWQKKNYFAFPSLVDLHSFFSFKGKYWFFFDCVIRERDSWYVREDRQSVFILKHIEEDTYVTVPQNQTMELMYSIQDMGQNVEKH